MKKGFMVIRAAIVIAITLIFVACFIEINIKILNALYTSNETEIMLNICRTFIEFIRADDSKFEPIEKSFGFNNFDEFKNEISADTIYNFIYFNNLKDPENKKYSLQIEISNCKFFTLIKVKCKGVRSEVELLYAKPL